MNPQGLRRAGYSRVSLPMLNLSILGGVYRAFPPKLCGTDDGIRTRMEQDHNLLHCLSATSDMERDERIELSP